MAHFKLNELDTDFLAVPKDAVLVASGTSGAETFIERERDVTVRIVIASVAVATMDGARLEAVIEIGAGQGPGSGEGGAAAGTAKGEDGPAPGDTHLQAMQSVQVVLKPGERIGFRAYPNATGATVLRTLVYTADVK